MERRQAIVKPVIEYPTQEAVGRGLVEHRQAIANPGPLGLGGFALTTFLLSLINAGILPTDSIGVVLGMAFMYGGLAQVLAGMWEFRVGNLFGATCFTSFGTFWMGLGLMRVLTLANIIPAVPAAGMFAFHFAWGLFTFYATFASFHGARGLRVLFILLTVTFFLLAIGDFAQPFRMIGGYLGLVVAFNAWYLSAAGLINGSLAKTVLKT